MDRPGSAIIGSGREAVNVLLIPFLMGLCATVCCYVASGETLGLWVGGIGMATLILPPMVARHNRFDHAFLAGMALVDGIAFGWIAGLRSEVSVVQWVAAVVVLGSYGAALGTATFAFCGWAGRRVEEGDAGVAPTVSAVVVALGVLWLTWPVWFFSASAATANWLVPAHPLFAINHVMVDQGIWLQNRIIYAHVTLGQDVAYELPRTIWPCVGVHLLVAAALVLGARVRTSSANVGAG